MVSAAFWTSVGIAIGHFVPGLYSVATAYLTNRFPVLKTIPVLKAILK